MSVRFSSEHERFGLQTLVLENELLRVEVLPELGGKIWSIVYKPRGRELLWHHPTIEPQLVVPGSSFDDHFSGGWDELFPNDSLVTIDGLFYPDHGELWTSVSEWRLVTESPREVTISLTNWAETTRTTIERRLALAAGEPALSIRYSIRNDGDCPLSFHWKLHPALHMGSNARIDIPAERVIIDPEFAAEFPELDGTWPIVEGRNRDQIDLRFTPDPVSKSTRFFYATELSEGWCGMTDLNEGIGVRFEFDREFFPAVTVFGTYGGWRDLHTTILEPCTGYPYQLDRAINAGRFLRIGVGESLETSVVCRISEN